MTRQVQSKAGTPLFIQHIDDVIAASENCEGFCLACGSDQFGVEPDARRYKCEACSKHKVFGAEELAIMGLTYGDRQ